MRLVKEVLPNGKVRFTRTYYVIFVSCIVGMIVCAGVLAALAVLVMLRSITP